jgi:DNA invertase Pin-like site-specific DNA recombinase
MAVYGYIRVSSQEQVLGTSLETQRRCIEGVAMIRGEHPVDAIFEDAGVSGSTPLQDRPAGSELWAKVRGGDVVIAAKLDRLFRNAADAHVTLQVFQKKGVKLVLVDLGNDPVTDGGMAKFLFSILTAVAEMERERIADRCNTGKRAKKAQGGHIGGSAPWGYEKIGTGKEAFLVSLAWRQEAYQTIADLAGSGVSFRRIAALMSAQYGPVSHEACRRIAKEGV